MTLSAKEENWAQYKSVYNMLYFYRKELRNLNNGNKITYVIPKGTRKRLVKHGFLFKFGSKFSLTNQGKKLLSKIHVSPIL